MSSSGKKKTQKRPRRPVIAGNKVNDDDFVQVDVPGDGNCFYYSIYGAAKYHVDPTTLDKLLACMYIQKETVHNFSDFVKAIRIRLATELDKPDGILEAQQRVPIEQLAALEYGARPQTNLYDMLKAYAQAVYAPKETPNYKEVLRALENDRQELRNATAALEIARSAHDVVKQAAARKAVAEAERKIAVSEDNLTTVIAFGNEMWQENIRTLPTQFRDSILARPELYNPAVQNHITLAKFKKEMAKLIAGVDAADRYDGSSKMYVSTFDYLLFKFMLEHCANTVYIESVHPTTGILVDTKNGHPVLNVLLLARIAGYEHYNFYVRGNKYKENIGKLREQAQKVRKQHAHKGNTPDTPESNSNNSLSSVSTSSNNSLSSVSNNNTPTPPPPEKNAFKILERMRAAKAAAAAASSAKPPAHKNVSLMVASALVSRPKEGMVHKTIKQQRGPYNNVRNQLAAMPPPRQSLGIQGELERLRALEYPPRPSAPPASPPRSMSPGAKAAIKAVENSERASKENDALKRARTHLQTLQAIQPASTSRGRTATRRAPKSPSPSPGTKAAIAAVNTAKAAEEAALIANNLPSNSNSSLPSINSNSNTNLRAAIKASKEQAEANAKKQGHKTQVKGILNIYNQPQSQQLSKTQTNLLASLGKTTRKNKK